MATQKDESAVHTLLTREIRPIRNWHEWLARWQMAEDFQWMESLLHVGFSVSLEREAHGEKEYNCIDRDIFYFSIADGWANRYLLQLPTDGDNEYYAVGRDSNGNVIKKGPNELRQQLARKAFDMLCLNFFKVELLRGGRRGDEFNDVWESLVVSERLFPIIQSFFRAEKAEFSDNVRIRNLSYRDERSHNERQAVNFLLNLAKFIWGWKKPDTKWYGSRKDEADKRFAATRARVDAAKPWMVEVLAELNGFDVLREWILELDKACLAKLKEVALRNELSQYRHPVTKDRQVATLDEACYVGSKTAWFFKEYELMTKEHKRLGAILEAEQQKTEANRRIDELTAKK